MVLNTIKIVLKDQDIGVKTLKQPMNVTHSNIVLKMCGLNTKSI